MAVTAQRLIRVIGMAFTALGAAAKFVSAKAGNIYLTDEVGTAKQLTFSGHLPSAGSLSGGKERQRRVSVSQLDFIHKKVSETQADMPTL